MFKNYKLKVKLILLTIGLLFMYGVTSLLISKSLIHTAIYKEKEKQTKGLVTIALGSLNHYYKMEQNGSLSRKEAQEKAKANIKSFLFGEKGSDYFFINDYNMIMIANPLLPELEGKDVSNLKDPTGLYLTKAFIEICKNKGSGFVPYKWQYYAEKGRIEPKLSYVSEFAPWGWIIGTGMYINDINSTLRHIEMVLMFSSLLSIAVAAIIAIIFALALVRPLNQTICLLKDIAEGEGDLTKRLVVKNNDEIGELSKWFNIFIEKIHTIIQQFGNNATTLSSASEELSATSSQIASNAEEMTAQSGTVASATEQANNSVNNISSAAEEMSAQVTNVATSIEEMSASLNEVSRNCQQESQIAATANKEAHSTLEIVVSLGAAAKSIGNVVEIINNIAAQTNLLALNASIEAATAGEAGKGFSVVACEVKELAKQTASATQKIGQQIEDMQTNTISAVKAIESITSVVEQIDTISQTILSAVEEQSTTINEISRNVSGVSICAKEVARNVTESATGLTEIASTISGVNDAVTDTSRGVVQISQSAVELAKLASGLEGIVKQFKV
jgi:methyl-accepting chemotaxis protein